MSVGRAGSAKLLLHSLNATESGDHILEVRAVSYQMAASFYQLVHLLIIQAKAGRDEIEKPQKVRLIDVFETKLDKMRLDGFLRG